MLIRVCFFFNCYKNLNVFLLYKERTHATLGCHTVIGSFTVSIQMKCTDYQIFGAAEALSLQNGGHFISQVLPVTTNR